MQAFILRRRKLGRTSCREVARMMEPAAAVVRNWRRPDMASLVLACEADDPIVFRWGCTSLLPDSVKVVNSAESIRWCSDKRTGRLAMQEAGVPVPQTWAADVFTHEAQYTGDMRFVLRPTQHAQGRNLVAGTRNEVVDAVLSGGIWAGGYVSRLVNKVAEYRVFVVQNRVAWVAQKTPGNPSDVAWNVARGGRFDNVRWSDWNTKVLDAALKAAKVSGTDFCGVDVMVDSDGSPYVLEVNSAPSQTSLYRQGCVAKAFSYIVENDKTPFEDVVWTEHKTWKSYIHPAVRGVSNG